MRTRLSVFLTVSLIGASTVGGCAATVQRERMEKNLNGYMGRTIAEFVADHGYPADSVALSDTEHSFHWHLSRMNNVGVVAPVGNAWLIAGPHEQVCDVYLRANTERAAPKLQDWRIVNWRWSGAC